MKKLTTSLVLLFGISLLAFAQSSNNSNIGLIKGNLYNSDNQPITYASVSLLNTQKELLQGVISEEDGHFLLEALPLDSLLLKVEFLGYQTLIQTLVLNKKNKKIDLGKVLLSKDLQQLEEVVVTAEKSQYSLQLDKKIFEVGKNTLAQGGSAIDVLEQVPLVSVEPSGAVSLRGSTQVQILVNGKRSGLTMNNALDQIPSDNIARVEVITNPSSSFDANGSAGIINIVLKRNEDEGWNGQISIDTGTPASHAIRPSLNYRNQKINLFSNLRWRYADYFGRYSTIQRRFQDSMTSSLNLKENENRHDDGRSGYFGGDYYIDAQNTITLAYYRSETKDTDLTFLNYELGNPEQEMFNFLRTGNSIENRNYNQIELNYTHDFTLKNEKLTFDFQYDFWNSTKHWDLATTGDFVPSYIGQDLRTTNQSGSRDYVFKSDYTRPLKNGSKLQTGAKFENRIVTNDYLAEILVDEEWSVYNQIDNDVRYTEKIGAAYLQYQGKHNKVGYSLGLRSEYTSTDVEDVENTFTSNNDYINLFPSAFLSYDIKDGNSVQLSYSKRINRPSLWMLYPFFEIKDFNSQEIGNPNLQASFTDAFEFSYLLVGDKITFNPNLYFKHTNDAFQSFLSQNDQRTFIVKPINIEQRQETGFEFSLRYQPTKFLTINNEFNFYHFNQKGRFEEQTLDAKGTTWSAGISASVNLPKDINAQANFDYWGAEQGAQIRQLSTHVLTLGISKDFFDDKFNFSIRAYNILDSRARRSISESEQFYIEQDARRNKARYGFRLVYRFSQVGNQRIRRESRGNR